MKTIAEKYLTDNNIETVLVDTGGKTSSIQVHQNGKQTSMEQVLAGFANFLTPITDENFEKEVEKQALLKYPDKERNYDAITPRRIAFYQGAKWALSHTPPPTHERVNWQSLRDKYFNECIASRTVKSEEGIPYDHQQWISYAPHDLFKWFKKQIATELTTDNISELDKWKTKGDSDER